MLLGYVRVHHHPQRRRGSFCSADMELHADEVGAGGRLMSKDDCHQEMPHHLSLQEGTSVFKKYDRIDSWGNSRGVEIGVFPV